MKAGNSNPRITEVMSRDQTVIWQEIERNIVQRGSSHGNKVRGIMGIAIDRLN